MPEFSQSSFSESPLSAPVPAGIGQRLANYLVDVIIFSVILTFLLVLAAPVYPLMQKIMAKEPFSIMDQLMVSFLYGLYMSVMETVLKGKTLGKYLTGTRAIQADGHRLNAQSAFKRGLIRIIPFEQFSAISFPPRPWHDRWSNTMVIDERKTAQAGKMAAERTTEIEN